MNGHCEFHAFEPAVDVCNVCFGDLCGSCVVALPGRRHPVCKKCAIQLSGVRKPRRPVVRGDKSTAKARRDRYANATGDDAYFQFFTTTTESESHSDTEHQRAAPSPERRPGRFRFGRRPSSSSDDGVDVAETTSSSGERDENRDPLGDGHGAGAATASRAVTRLSRLRQSLHHRGAGHDDSDSTETKTPIDDDKDAGEQSIGPEGAPDLALAMSTTISTTTTHAVSTNPSTTGSTTASTASTTDEPASTPGDEPASDPQPLRSIASQVAASRPLSTDQPLDPGNLDPTSGLDDRDEPERFEPADLSVNPFELAESKSPESAAMGNRPEVDHRSGHTDRPVDEIHPDHIDTEGRWIPPALRGADS